MRTIVWTLPIALGLIWWTTGCGSGPAEGMEPGGLGPRTTQAEFDQGAVHSSVAERGFWMALAEEPAWHLNKARELYMEGETKRASMELTKVASILDFERRHCHSPREGGLLLASVQELREVARVLRYQDHPNERVFSIRALDRVEALALRTIAAHQVTLARDALEAGDGRMAGRYISETVTSIQAGFNRGGIEVGSAVTGELESARKVANRLEIEGNGSRDEGLRALDDLDSEVKGLGETLTGGRR